MIIKSLVNQILEEKLKIQKENVYLRIKELSFKEYYLKNSSMNDDNIALLF